MALSHRFLLLLLGWKGVLATELYFECLNCTIDFETAQDWCGRRNMTVVTVRNEEEQENLKSLVRTEQCDRYVVYRKGWLNYKDGEWLGPVAYPLIYSNWAKNPSTKCALFSTKYWTTKRCTNEVANVLLCESRRDEDAGKVALQLAQGAAITSLNSVSTNVTVEFATGADNLLMIEQVGTELHIFCHERNNASRLATVTVVANNTETEIIRANNERSIGPALTGESLLISLRDDSSGLGCLITNLTIRDGGPGNNTIGWGSYNWNISGSHKFIDLPPLDSVCKEGTFKKGDTCIPCPMATYQNLRNQDFCKSCPDTTTTDVRLGHVVCGCMTGWTCDEAANLLAEPTLPSLETTPQRLNSTAAPVILSYTATSPVSDADVELEKIAEIEVTADNAEEVSELLAEATSDMSRVSAAGVAAVAGVLEQLVEISGSEEAVVGIASNVMTANEEALLTESKNSIHNSLSKTAENLSNLEEDVTIATDNVDIVTRKIQGGEEAKIKTNETDVRIPSYLTSQTSGAYMVVFKNAKLFSTPANTTVATISDLYLNDLDVEESEEEIALTFAGTEDWEENATHAIECVYWTGDDWSGYGCRYDEGTCYCNHTTAFTALLSFQGLWSRTGGNDTMEKGPGEEAWLHWVEVACFILSICCAIGFLCTIIFIRGLRTLQSFKIHGILAVSLIFFYLAYLTSNLTQPQGVACRLLAILVHWSTLCTFLAMLVEAVTVYLAIVVVFNSYISHVVIKAASFVWGVPTAIVAVIVGATKGTIYDENTCLLISPYGVYLQSIPVMLIILVNSFIFGGVMIHTIRQKLQRTTFDNGQFIAQLKMAFTLNSIFGIGYVLGLLTEYSVILRVLFSLFNGLTGVFVLCLFAVFNPLTRKSVKKSVRGRFQRIPNSEHNTTSSSLNSKRNNS